MRNRLARAALGSALTVALLGLVPAPAYAQSADPTGALTGLNGPAGIAFAPNGTAYVVNEAPNTISVFPAGATAATATLGPLTDPVGVAVRASTGEIFVANGVSGIAVLDPGAAVANPAKTRTATGDIVGVAFAPNGDLYATATSPTNKVYVFTGDSLTPTSSFNACGGAFGLAFQPISGDLFVACPPTHAVAVYDAGTTTPNPAKTLMLAVTQSPLEIAFHPASLVAYVGNVSGGPVLAFPPGATSPTGDALVGPNTPVGIAVDPLTGRTFVASNSTGTVLPYAAPVPTVTAVAPATGPMTGGTTVTLTGTNLAAVTEVTFAGIPGTSVTAQSATSLTVVSPAHDPGATTVSARWLGTAGVAPTSFTFTPVAPGPPTGVSAIPGNGQATISWTPPTFIGGSPITGYTVAASPGTLACGTTATSCVLTGLTNGTAYTFTVTATNSAGTSTPSTASAAVTPTSMLPVTVKSARRASSKLPRRGTRRLVKSASTTNELGALAVTGTCAKAGSALPTSVLCQFIYGRWGKVSVRTKGHRNVTVTLVIQSLPRTPNPALSWGKWQRSWKVK